MEKENIAPIELSLLERVAIMELEMEKFKSKLNELIQRLNK